MKKSIIALSALLLFAAGAYAQTQRLNRTNSRTHDRSDASNPGRSTDQQVRNRPDRTNHENDMDRNNTNNNTNTTPNTTGTRVGNTNTGSGTNGVNTNGGTGTNGSNINSNNPR